MTAPAHTTELVPVAHPTPAEAVAILRKIAHQKAMWPGDNDFEDAANIIERQEAEILSLRAKLAKYEAALKNAKSCLTAIGGDPRSIIAEHGSATGDEIQAAMLDQIDAALESTTHG
jgi:hypothetical protein